MGVVTSSAENDALRERIADALFASKALSAAMAFGVPREAWEDCRQRIADDVLSIIPPEVKS